MNFNFNRAWRWGCRTMAVLHAGVGGFYLGLGVRDSALVLVGWGLLFLVGAGVWFVLSWSEFD